jgi:hypothetical protein
LGRARRVSRVTAFSLCIHDNLREFAAATTLLLVLDQGGELQGAAKRFHLGLPEAMLPISE